MHDWGSDMQTCLQVVKKGVERSTIRNRADNSVLENSPQEEKESRALEVQTRSSKGTLLWNHISIPYTIYRNEPALRCSIWVPALSSALQDGKVSASPVVRVRNRVSTFLLPRHRRGCSSGTRFQPEVALRWSCPGQQLSPFSVSHCNKQHRPILKQNKPLG